MFGRAARGLAISCSVWISWQSMGSPVLSGFNPGAGAPGDPVQLNGSGFASGNLTVRFWNGGNGVSARIVAVHSDSSMTVSVPNGLTTGPISVQQGSGARAYSLQDFQAIGSGPFITGLAPEFGDVGESVNITGLHLGNTTGVLFHGTRATEFWPNAAGTQITVRVPAGAGSGAITVITSAGTSNSPMPFTAVGPAPFITDFFPISGVAGTQVQIRGRHLGGVSRVTFNGLPGVNLAASSDILIVVQAPAAVTTGPIGVYSPLGSALTSSNFYAQPTIVSFTPTSGAPGDQVQLTGTGFSFGSLAIRFWNAGAGVAAKTVVIHSDTGMTVTVPTGLATGPLSVQRGTGPLSYSKQDFVRIGSGPIITRIDPDFGEAGDTIRIEGVHFGNSKTVAFHGANATEFWTDATGTQITTIVPHGAISGAITVTTAAGSTNSPTSFTVVGAVPFIADFSPKSGDAGTRLQISGRHFAGTTRVTFNGQPGVNLALNSDALIQVEAPPNVTSGLIAVYTAQGTGLSASNFYAAPVITGFSPAEGCAGTNVLITGCNFAGTTAVHFNGRPSTNITVVNNGSLRALVPFGASTGPLRVIAPGGSAFSLLNFKVPGDTTRAPEDNPDPISGSTPEKTNNVEPPILLSIGQLAGHAQLSWPAELSQFVLEYQTPLSGTSLWRPVVVEPLLSGNRLVVTETNAATTRFYRLRR